MMVTMLLADAAQAVGNKLYILGGGWSITGPDPTPSAIALHIKVPWDQANRRHQLRLALLDSDGHAVEIKGDHEATGETAPAPLVFETDFEVGRPAGLAAGTPIDLSFAITVPPLPLEPGRRFEWRLRIDDRAESHWHLAFSTLAAHPKRAREGR